MDRLLLGGALSWAAGVTAPALIYLWPVRKEGPQNPTIAAGPANDLPVGAAKMLEANGKPVLLIRLAESDFRAFSATCTHLGCGVHWDREKNEIICPCHGGRFDPTGKVVGGPPPDPLPRYQVIVSDGEVRIKLSVWS